jgi:hypothetical protein
MAAQLVARLPIEHTDEVSGKATDLSTVIFSRL